MDLLQIAYAVTTHLGFGALAVALGRDGAVSARVSRAVGTAGAGLAALVVVAAALAGAVAGTLGTVAAWVAFLLTIPFMSTLLPYALGIGLLMRAVTARTRSPRLRAAPGRTRSACPRSRCEAAPDVPFERVDHVQAAPHLWAVDTDVAAGARR